MKKLMAMFCVLGVYALTAPFSVTLASPTGGQRPSIRITSPRNGATIRGSSVTIHVAISNFKLVKPVLLTPDKWNTIPLLKGNQGHIHYILDKVSNLVLSRDVVVKTTHTWTHVSPGPHTLIAYLATSQHVRFPGTRAAVVHVVVASGAAPEAHSVKPSLRIVSVHQQPTRRGALVAIRVAVSHFRLVRPLYRMPPLVKGNVGHIHYVLDSLRNFKVTRDAVSALRHPWYNVAPGHHMIMVYLANTQHRRFPGTPIVRVPITVAAPKTGGKSVVTAVARLPTTGGGDSRPSSSRLDVPVPLIALIAVFLGMVLRRLDSTPAKRHESAHPPQ